MRHNKPINSSKKPMNGFFEWLDEFAANASAKVFEPLIDSSVKSWVSINTGLGKGLGAYLGDKNTYKDLIATGVALEGGGLGLLGLGDDGTDELGTGTGTGSNSEKNTKTVKYILGGLALLGVGYYVINDK